MVTLVVYEDNEELLRQEYETYDQAIWVVREKLERVNNPYSGQVTWWYEII